MTAERLRGLLAGMRWSSSALARALHEANPDTPLATWERLVRRQCAGQEDVDPVVAAWLEDFAPYVGGLMALYPAPVVKFA